MNGSARKGRRQGVLYSVHEVFVMMKRNLRRKACLKRFSVEKEYVGRGEPRLTANAFAYHLCLHGMHLSSLVAHVSFFLPSSASVLCRYAFSSEAAVSRFYHGLMVTFYCARFDAFGSANHSESNTIAHF